MGFFDDIGKAVGGAVNTAVKVTTAPASVVINTARAATGNAPPAAIYQPYVDVAHSAGNTIQSATTVIAAPKEEIYRRVQSLAKQAGPGAEFVFDLGTYANRYSDQLASSGSYAAANGLRLQNPLQVLAVPLAAAVRSARERYDHAAKPLPSDVRAGLQGKFPDQTLSSARYTKGKLEITLPNGIGKGWRFMDGSDYAVVVDEIIVFNVDPPDFQSGDWWWAHELTHVLQYQRWGIERFAFEYLKDLGRSVEGEANQKGDSVSVQSRSAALEAASIDPQPKSVPSSVMNVDLPDVSSLPTEAYAARCVFVSDPFPVDYLITDRGRIVVVERATGRSMQIGWAVPPTADAAVDGVAWLYRTNNLSYGVTNDGRILQKQFNAWGQQMPPLLIGYVEGLR